MIDAPQSLPALLTPDEVARALRVSPETIRRWLRTGLLGGIRLEGRRGGWRVSEADIAVFIERLRRQPQT